MDLDNEGYSGSCGQSEWDRKPAFRNRIMGWQQGRCHIHRAVEQVALQAIVPFAEMMAALWLESGAVIRPARTLAIPLEAGPRDDVAPALSSRHGPGLTRRGRLDSGCGPPGALR
jgi:hypothetical protein